MKRCSEIISIDEYINYLNNGILYEGYVENIGYAYHEHSFIPPKNTRKSYEHYGSCYACKLEISVDTIKKYREIPQMEVKGYDNRKSDKIMDGTVLLCSALLADDVTGIGVADDVAIPFIFAGGCIIALVCFAFEGRGGNENYPGPWATTEPAPFSPQSTPREPPLPPPDFPPSGGIMFVVGAATLYESFVKTTNPFDDDIIDLKKHVNESAKKKSIQNTMQMDSLREEKIRKFSDLIIQNFINANDAIRVEKPGFILQNEISK